MRSLSKIAKFVTLAALAAVDSVEGQRPVWKVETPEPSVATGFYGAFPAVAIDQSGTTHVIYNATNGVRYLRGTQGSWTSEQIPYSSNNYSPTMGTAMVLDPGGGPHVALINNDDTENGAYGTWLTYATKTGGNWSLVWSPLSRDGWLGGVAIARDLAGCASIAYGATAGWWLGDGVHYVHRAGNTCNLYADDRIALVQNGTPGRNSLAIDGQGDAHLICNWISTGAGTVKYITNSGGGWLTELIPASSGTATFALDASGRPHVSYSRSGELAHAVRTAGQWVTELVDTVGIALAGGTSIAMDAHDQPHIAYRCWPTSSGESDLRYATKSGGQWIVSEVDTAGNTGYQPTIALDLAGIPRIAYQGSNRLRVARLMIFAARDKTTTEESSKGIELVVFPNPSRRGETRIGFFGGGRRSVQIGIYDASGRIVRDLGAAKSVEFPGEIEWDGSDHNGKKVSPGLYFIRADFGRETISRRFALSR